MIPILKRATRRIMRAAGYDLVSYRPLSHALARRAKILSHQRIDLILDVGANIGQYARQMREIGYAGRIVSFEPVTGAFAELRTAARHDPSWEAVNIALGDRDEEQEIRIAGNSQSSSLLDMLPEHLKAAPESAYSGSQWVPVRRLDGVFGQYCKDGERVFLKVDAQGFERRIMDGSAACLGRIQGVQLETSLVPLYRDETLFPE
ncbi:MAG: FkbM family methyltransferase, partial [Burkholderiales bacterium]